MSSGVGESQGSSRLVTEGTGVNGLTQDNQLNLKIIKCLALFLGHLSYVEMPEIKGAHVIFCNSVLVHVKSPQPRQN